MPSEFSCCWESLYKKTDKIVLIAFIAIMMRKKKKEKKVNTRHNQATVCKSLREMEDFIKTRRILFLNGIKLFFDNI